MLRGILSVIAGNVVWTILWLTLNAVLAGIYPKSFDGNTRLESVPLLLLILVGSVIFSIIAGYITALIAKRKELKHTMTLGLLQLAMGIFFQAQNWHLLPIWYHISFLTLLIPGNLLGGVARQRTSRRN